MRTFLVAVILIFACCPLSMILGDSRLSLLEEVGKFDGLACECPDEGGC